MTPPYQLTRFPIGSLREIITVSWPIILGLLSVGLMLFVDRLFLANYSLEALNAGATGGMASFLLNIFPMVVAGMSEVFVGRLHGKEENHEIGRSVWQMIWFSLATAPFFWFFSRAFTPLLFYGSPLIEEERNYFVTNSDFGPFWCLSVALFGFYVGIGRSRIVMLVTIIGNALNILLDYLLIFGIGPFPEMGVKGAALATGLSILFQALLFLSGFLSRSNHTLYKTRNFAFTLKLCIDNVAVGIPAGMGRFMEACAHMIFLRAVSFSGLENLTIVAIIQSIYILISFFSDGLSKGVAAIVSNLIGASHWNEIGRVLRAAICQHLIVFGALTIGLLYFSEFIIAIFLSEEERILLHDPLFMSTALISLTWMCIFFLFDGLSWIIVGQLMAAQDTKFLFYASLGLNWVAYAIPTLLGMLYFQWGAIEAWIIIAISAIINFCLMSGRYLSDRWRLSSGAKGRNPLSSS